MAVEQEQENSHGTKVGSWGQSEEGGNIFIFFNVFIVGVAPIASLFWLSAPLNFTGW